MFRGRQFAIQAGASFLLGIVSIASVGCQDRNAPEDTWVPAVAKVRRTVTEIPAAGAPVEMEVWEGSFFRDFRGSQLRRLEQIFPRPSQSTLKGTFFDRSGPQWKTYRLEFPTYSPISSLGTAPERPDPVASREQLISAGRREDIANGIPCYVVPFGDQAPGAVGFSGRTCYSPEYELHLYLELDRTGEDGSTLRERTEFLDFQLGVAPDADEMCFPPGLAVQDSIYRTCPD